MKTKWFVLGMLTVLVSLSVSIVQVEAMTLDLSGGVQLDDGGGDAPEPAELYPVNLTDGGGVTPADPNEPAE
jgi:hypothetical protein